MPNIKNSILRPKISESQTHFISFHIFVLLKKIPNFPQVFDYLTCLEYVDHNPREIWQALC